MEKSDKNTPPVRCYEGPYNPKAFLEFLLSLPEKDQEEAVRDFAPWNQKYNLENVKHSRELCHIHHPRKYNNKFKFIHQDEMTGKYFHTNDIQDYIEDCHGKARQGATLKESEIIPKERRQILFVITKNVIGSDNTAKAATELKKWLKDKYDINSRYFIIINEEENAIEIRFEDIVVDDYEHKIKILKEFKDEYNGEYKEEIKSMLSCQKDDSSMLYEKVMGVFDERYMENSSDKMAVKLFTKCLEDKSIGIPRLKSLEKYYNKNGLSGKVSDENKKIQIINNININIFSGDVNIVNNFHDNTNEDIDEFVKYIKEDKPEWYCPGEFIPKQLLADMFNEFANVEKDVKQMNTLFKDKLFVEEKRLTKKYSNKKRRFRCIKCLAYKNL